MHKDTHTHCAHDAINFASRCIEITAHLSVCVCACYLQRVRTTHKARSFIARLIIIINIFVRRRHSHTRSLFKIMRSVAVRCQSDGAPVCVQLGGDQQQQSHRYASSHRAPIVRRRFIIALPPKCARAPHLTHSPAAHLPRSSSPSVDGIVNII